MVQFSFRPPGADYLGFEATPEGIIETACKAEELGFDAVLLNDHIIVDGSPRALLGQYLRSVDCPVLYSGAHDPYPSWHFCAHYAISESRGHSQNDGHAGPDVRRTPHCRRGGRVV